MKQYQFKTNINCSGCITNVTPSLDGVIGENNWSVDTRDPKKILTVVVGDVSETEVIKAVSQAGYKAEKL